MEKFSLAMIAYCTICSSWASGVTPVLRATSCPLTKRITVGIAVILKRVVISRSESTSISRMAYPCSRSLSIAEFIC